jgi:hypothetical protein
VPFYVNLDTKRHNFEIIWHKLLGTLWKHKKEEKKKKKRREGEKDFA